MNVNVYHKIAWKIIRSKRLSIYRRFCQWKLTVRAKVDCACESWLCVRKLTVRVSAQPTSVLWKLTVRVKVDCRGLWKLTVHVKVDCACESWLHLGLKVDRTLKVDCAPGSESWPYSESWLCAWVRKLTERPSESWPPRRGMGDQSAFLIHKYNTFTGT